MEPISFFTPIEYIESKNVCSKDTLQFVDDFFSLGGWKATVIPGYGVRGKEGVILTEDNPSLLVIALKVAFYVTLIVPLVLFAVKFVLRSTHQFYQLDDKDTPAAKIYLRAVKGEPIGNSEDLRMLKISQMSKSKIEYQFSEHTSTLFGKENRPKMRFSHLPAEEVHDALYKDLLPENVYSYITPEQLTGLRYSRLQRSQIEAIFCSPFLNENEKKEQFEKIAPKEIQELLYSNKLPMNLYDMITVEQLKGLELTGLTLPQIEALFTQKAESIEKSKRRFESLSKESVQNALYADLLLYSQQFVRADQLMGLVLSNMPDPTNVESSDKLYIHKQNQIALLFSRLKEAEVQKVIASIPDEEMKKAIEQDCFPYKYMPLITDEQFKKLDFTACSSNAVSELFNCSEEVALQRAKLIPMELIFDSYSSSILEGKIPNKFFEEALENKKLNYDQANLALEYEKITEEQFQKAVTAGKISKPKETLVA